MLHQSLLLTIVLGGSPTSHPPLDEPVCAPVPPAPTRIASSPIAATRDDGSQSWGAVATYRLSSGDIAEAFLVIDSDGTAEAQLMIDGDVMAHAAIAMNGDTPLVTTWYPPTLDHPPELIAEMMVVDLPAVVAESLPQEFKCSGWAKKMLAAGRYAWRGALAASTAVCCGGSVGALCPACLAGIAVGGMYVDHKLANHCD